jgi:hypothetical protein
MARERKHPAAVITGLASIPQRISSSWSDLVRPSTSFLGRRSTDACKLVDGRAKHDHDDGAFQANLIVITGLVSVIHVDWPRLVDGMDCRDKPGNDDRLGM